MRNRFSKSKGLTPEPNNRGNYSRYIEVPKKINFLNWFKKWIKG